jgi:hypothetical protein
VVVVGCQQALRGGDQVLMERPIVVAQRGGFSR